MDKVQLVMNGFWGGVVVGMVAIPVAKYLLNRFGGPMWEAVKKIGYNVWEDAKKLVKR